MNISQGIKKARREPRHEMLSGNLIAGCRRGGGGFCGDIDAAAFFIEFDFAVDEREERPVAAGANVLPGFKLSAALADQDAAGCDKFSAKAFYTEALADAIAPVADAALTFLMCHKFS